MKPSAKNQRYQQAFAVALALVGGVAVTAWLGAGFGLVFAALASVMFAVWSGESPSTAPAPVEPEHHALTLVDQLSNGRYSEVAAQFSDGGEDLVSRLRQLGHTLQQERTAAVQREAELRTTGSGYAVVAERLETDLQNLQEQMETSLRVRDGFLMRMSHELRTPLNAILGYVDLVQEESDAGVIGEDLARIRASALHLLALITSILDLTQLQSNKFDVIPENLSLSGLVRRIVDSLTGEAEAKGNTLKVDLPDDLVVSLDRRMLHAVIFNLVANATKYTHKGTVSVAARGTTGGVELSISDDGIGMTGRQLEAAFQPFDQFDLSTTRQYDGAGLGLAVVRGFVEAMNGTVEIESEPGRGAVVTVWLPAACERRVAGKRRDEEPTILVR